MKISKKGLDLIKSFEGLKLKPYLCSAKVPTIGYGSTRYSNGVRVTLKDKDITIEQASEMLLLDVKAFEKDVTKLLGSTVVNQNQFDALVSFAYNVGSDIDMDMLAEGLGDSTLLKKVLANPSDPTIRNEFLKWNKAAGKVVNGLIARREKEANHYFSL